MSREIKFRAWDKKENEMMTEFRGKYVVSNIGLLNPVGDKFDLIDGTRFELMQYTEIKDVTGKEIYEGDIVEFYNDEYYVLHPGIAKVIFDLGAFQLESKKYGADYLGNMDIDDMDIRVIGNIYANPELLEKLESEVEQ